MSCVRASSRRTRKPLFTRFGSRCPDRGNHPTRFCIGPWSSADVFSPANRKEMCGSFAGVRTTYTQDFDTLGPPKILPGPVPPALTFSFLSSFSLAFAAAPSPRPPCHTPAGTLHVSVTSSVPADLHPHFFSVAVQPLSFDHPTRYHPLLLYSSCPSLV